MSEVVAAARSVSKVFDTRFALLNVDFELRRGEVVALLGPNGAGKSTLLNILATQSRPSRGTVTLFGMPIERAAAEARGRIGVCAHATFLYEDLTARENLQFYARLYGVADSAVLPMLERFNVAHRAEDRVRALSRGLQQRVALARTLLSGPEILLLDEPTTGLDREATALLVDVVKTERAAGRLILVATHDFSAASALADRSLVLCRGRVAYDGPSDSDPSRLAARYAQVTSITHTHPARAAVAHAPDPTSA